MNMQRIKPLNKTPKSEQIKLISVGVVYNEYHKIYVSAHSLNGSNESDSNVVNVACHST